MSNRSQRVEATVALAVALGLSAVGNAIAQDAITHDAPSSPRAYLQRMDSNGDGRVDEAEYVAYMSRGFVRMDTDGNGVLDGDELPPGSRPVSLAQYQQNLRAAFHRQDGNHDGLLDAAELSRPPPAR